MVRRQALALVAVAGMALAGCSSNEPNAAPVAATSPAASTAPATTTTTTEAPEPLSKDDIEQFAETAWVDGDPEGAKDFVVPGSPADRYLDFQLAALKAEAASGYDAADVDTTVEWDDDVLVMKDDDGKDGGTYRLKNWKGQDGKVSTWTQRNFEIGTHLAKPARKSGGVADVELLGGWANQNSLFLVFDIKAKRNLKIGYDTSYVDADHRATDSSSVLAADTLKKGSKNYVLVLFDKAQIGGRVDLAFEDARSYDRLGTVKIPVKP